MASVSFAELLRTSTSKTAKLNNTYTISRRNNSFCFQTFQRQAKKAEDSSNILKNIGLTESMFELYKVNSLYDFSYTKVKLYEYEELLAQNIKKALLDSDVEFNSLEIVIHFEKFPETAFTEKDNPALKITIIASDISDGYTGEYVEMFYGLLLSIDRNEGLKEEERLKAKATILPLLLVQCENKIFLESFIDFLEVNFSCFVSPLKFSTMDLKWILVLSSYPSREKTSRTTVLEYKTKDYIFSEKSVHTIFNKVIEPSTQLITGDIVNEFFSVFESKICELFKTDISQRELIAVRTPLGIFRRNDSVHTFKAYDSNKLYFVMRYLTHLAQEVVAS